MTSLAQTAYKAALEWYVDNGVDEALGDMSVDRTKITPPNVTSILHNLKPEKEGSSTSSVMQELRGPSPQAAQDQTPLGASDARAESVKLAQEASTLEELREAIAEFEGISLKKTATNLVFCDGNPKAPVMLIGEAPGADEDRLGKPFVGQSGQLLDKIFKCIGLDRAEEDPAKSIYISNILNWRPPGNRTPAPGEVEASLPFIERHIQLVQPKVLVFCGGVSAKALLGRTDGISRMRKLWHGYLPQTPELKSGSEIIPAIATYHPAYLLRTPSQKKAVWADMLMIQQKLKETGIV
ncbi:MAG: DNA polymerase [Micavibrio sp.]|nr:MAG: DNA polymerase [Micavibrio sp.]